jgi:hypothetical protein
MLLFRHCEPQTGIVPKQYVVRAFFDKLRDHFLKRLISFIGYAFQHGPHLIQLGERFLRQSQDKGVSTRAVAVNHSEGAMHHVAAIFQGVALRGSGAKILRKTVELSSTRPTAFREKLFIFTDLCQELYEFQETLVEFTMRLLDASRILHGHSYCKAVSIGFTEPIG